MRLLSLTLMVAAVAASVAIAGSRPATAAQSCKCNSILIHSGFCTEWICHPVDMAVPTLKSVRSSRECHKSQVLICDYGSCKVVCDPSQK